MPILLFFDQIAKFVYNLFIYQKEQTKIAKTLTFFALAFPTSINIEDACNVI